MTSETIHDEQGRKWRVVPPCIFCSHTTAYEVFANGGGWSEGNCPANGNQRHIRPGDFPEAVLTVIRESRGIVP